MPLKYHLETIKDFYSNFWGKEWNDTWQNVMRITAQWFNKYERKKAEINIGLREKVMGFSWKLNQNFPVVEAISEYMSVSDLVNFKIPSIIVETMKISRLKFI